MTCYPTQKLGQLCDVSIGRTPRRSESKYWGGLYPWATIRDLNGGKLMSTREGITDVALKEVMPYPVQPNTLLFSFKLSIGKMAFAGQPMYHNEAIAALPIRNPGILDSAFLYHVLKAKAHEETASHAVKGKCLNKRKVEQIEIPLPPLDEQRRIADIMNRAAKIEQLRKQAQERLREFIPALFVKMFGDPVTNPMGWDVCELSKLSILGPQYGANARSVPLIAGQPRYIRITDIDEHGTLSRESVGINMTNYERYRLSDGDLLFARSGTVGKSYLYRDSHGPCVFAGYLIRFRLDTNKVHPDFLFAFTRGSAYLDWVEGKRRTAVQANINGREYGILPVPVPPIDLQRRFAEVAKAIQDIVSRIELGNQIAASIRSSLMSCLIER